MSRLQHKHFNAGPVLPVIGAITCVSLVLPWTSGRSVEQYQIAGILIAIGIALWLVTWFTHGRHMPKDAPLASTEELRSARDGRAALGRGSMHTGAGRASPRRISLRHCRALAEPASL